jgi:hypothetical protein
MRFKAVTLGFVLASTALGSAALNLGRARGAAWIGQSLELVVPVQIDSAQADGALCAEADVYHGDSRQDSSRIQVQVEPTGLPDTFNLRILSSALIDEPVVTVYLRAGCSQKSSRKFVLLADFPNESVATQSRESAPASVPTVLPTEAASNTVIQPKSAAAAFPAVVSKAAVAPLGAAAKPSSVQEAAAPAPKASVAVKKSEKKSPKAEKPAAVQEPSTRSSSQGKSRLQLDPVDSLSWRIKSLEATNASNANKVVQEQVARDSQKMQQLQADLRSLLDQAVKNEASLAAMRERLENAESDRVPLTIVYTLIALLLLLVATLTYLLSRQARHVRRAASDEAAELTGTEIAATAAQQDLNGAIPPSQAKDIDVNLLDLDDASFGEMTGDTSGAILARQTRHHNFNADALVDLRQQADFLAKLGKVDEAMKVLEGGIRSNPVESPLLYLDLLVIANNSSRKTDFRYFSAEFVELFNAVVPEFALFRDEGRKLDAYPALLEHINGQWESPNVLDVIEACILRDPDSSESDPFDLAAFRDLLNLHAAAIELHHVNAAVS